MPLGDLTEQRDLLLGIDAVTCFDLVDRDQARPIAALLVDRLQQQSDVVLMLGVREDPLEGGDRMLLSGLELQDLGVGLDGAAKLSEVLLPQRAQASEQRDRLLRLVGGERQLSLQVVGQLTILAAREIEPIERTQGLNVAGIVLENDVPGDDRLLDVAEHLFPDRGDPDPDLFPLVRVLDQLRLLEQRVDQIAPALGAGVEPLQRHQRRGVLGLDALGAAEVLHGALGVTQLLVVGDRDDQQQLALERRGELLFPLVDKRLLVERDQRLPVVEDVGEVLERLARRRRGRVLRRPPGRRRPRPGRCSRAFLRARRCAAAARRGRRSSSRGPA